MTLFLSLTACIGDEKNTDTITAADTTLTTPADSPAATLPETEPPVPPPPLPTLADLQVKLTLSESGGQ
ncbi:MAG: hypothetical protein IJD38_01875 [Clostridia bacterium]|nr:hypothetical protein [Clostridia bacterium]